MANDMQSIIVITGAAGGLGTSLALLLGQNPKNHLVLSARTAEKSENAVEAVKSSSPALKASVSSLTLDITNTSSVEAARNLLSQKFGRIDVLIHNAGVLNQDEDLAKSVVINVEVNVAGPVKVTNSFLPLLLKSDAPRLVFISTEMGSLAGRTDTNSPSYAFDFDGYRASKAALNVIMLGYYRALQEKHLEGPNGGIGVKVHGVCPGFLATDFAAPADYMRQQGAIEPEAGAAVVVDVLAGGRDDTMGRVVAADGLVHPW